MSWFDWSLCQRHADLHRFVQLLIQLRLRFFANPRGNFLSLSPNSSSEQRSSGMGCNCGRPTFRLTLTASPRLPTLRREADST